MIENASIKYNSPLRKINDDSSSRGSVIRVRDRYPQLRYSRRVRHTEKKRFTHDRFSSSAINGTRAQC